MYLFNWKKNFFLIFATIALAFVSGCSAGKSMSICGYSFEYSGFITQGNLIEEKIIQDLRDSGASVNEQPVQPPKSIMKRQPTFRPRPKKNIYAEFNCGKSTKMAALLFPLGENNYSVDMIRKFAGKICEKNNAGLVAAFVQPGQENAAAKKILNDYGDNLYCLSVPDKNSAEKSRNIFLNELDNSQRTQEIDRICH